MTIQIADVLSVTKQREAEYGSFRDNGNLSSFLWDYFEHDIRYEKGYIKEAVHVICSKISRIINGSLDHDDNWIDIGGYSNCVLDILHKEVSQNIYKPTGYSQTFLDATGQFNTKRVPYPINLSAFKGYTSFKDYLVQPILKALQLGIFSEQINHVETWCQILNASLQALSILENQRGNNELLDKG